MSDPLTSLGDALLPGYQIERQVGQGGMATVYLARDLRHHRPVALKVLRPELTVALGPERFLREIEIAARLSHPHIVPLLDSGAIAARPGAPGLLYYTMPYVEGESLRARLRREPQLPIAEAIRITTELASAIDYAHGQGIVHRDLKPENVLFSSGQAVLADFGIAYALDAAGGDRLTSTGLVLGTPDYMSPEHASRDPRLDGRTDIYSLGCLLYEMLAGEAPYAGGSSRTVVARHAGAPVPDVRVLRPTVPAAVGIAIATALAKSPADRFATAGALVAALTSPPGDETAVPRRTRRRRLWVGAGLAVAVIGSLVAVALRRGARAPIESLAVLPLENLSGDPSQEYFADGMTEALITELARIGSLRVISRTSVMRYKGTQRSIRQIAEELGVEGVIEGSVARAADTVRVTTQLIDARRDRHVWVETFDRDLSNILVLQREVAQAIGGQVRAVLSPGEAGGTPVNPQAYDAFLIGKHHAWRLTPSDFELAIRYLGEALRLDSTMVPAYETLASLYSNAPAFGLLNAAVAFPQAESVAVKALRIDGRSAKAYRALGHVRFLAHWDWPGAEQAFKRSLELDAKDVASMADYGWFLCLTGRAEQGIRMNAPGLAADPLSLIQHNSNGWCHYFHRDYTQTIGEAKAALALDSAFAPSGSQLALAYSASGRHAEAIASLPVARFFPRTTAAIVLARAGRQGEARALLAEETGGGGPTVPASMVSWAFAVVGDRESALRWLERAYRERDWYLTWLKALPDFDPLRGEARFQRVLRGVGLDRDFE